MRSKYTYSFSIDGREYKIQNGSFEKKYITDELFEVRECPKCGSVNGPFESNCCKCKTFLPVQTVHIARHKKRKGLGLLIGAIISGVLLTTIQVLLNRRFGGLLTYAVIGFCITMGYLIAGTKIVVDDLATEDYRAYQTKQMNDSVRKATEEEINKLKLTRTCSSCGSKIEEDCAYCSNCGTKLI